MRLVRFRHKGLRLLYVDDDARAVPPAMAVKLRNLLFTLETAASIEEVVKFPGRKLHPLRGNLKGFWSVSVTGNWRLIFCYDRESDTVSDLDLVDYH